MSQRNHDAPTRTHDRRPPSPVVASDADRLREGQALESGDALPPPRRPVH